LTSNVDEHCQGLFWLLDLNVLMDVF